MRRLGGDSEGSWQPPKPTVPQPLRRWQAYLLHSIGHSSSSTIMLRQEVAGCYHSSDFEDMSNDSSCLSWWRWLGTQSLTYACGCAPKNPPDHPHSRLLRTIVAQYASCRPRQVSKSTLEATVLDSCHGSMDGHCTEIPLSCVCSWLPTSVQKAWSLNSLQSRQDMHMNLTLYRCGHKDRVWRCEVNILVSTPALPASCFCAGVYSCSKAAGLA